MGHPGLLAEVKKKEKMTVHVMTLKASAQKCYTSLLLNLICQTFILTTVISQ